MSLSNVKGYRDLIAEFLVGHMSAQQFQSDYIRLFKSDDMRRYSDDLYELVNAAFVYADSFAADPSSIGPWAVGDAELRSKLKPLLEQLDALQD